MNRENAYINAVRLALPTDTRRPKITVANMRRWIYLMENRSTVSLERIPDDVITQEYARSITVICSTGHPTKFIQVLYDTAEDILSEIKSHTDDVEDSLVNSITKQGEKRHNFCMRLIRDLFERSSQDHLMDIESDSDASV
jgi:hypothetical protein